ncbi:ComEA family DNA-binding protein [Cellulomonas sp.]|uniref:ComEA family DNA-binding protein n=1 Tax=Cellulomonas sp. TaxID=40001 RepID=UPI0025908A2A|nr:ComEA family DNA-binding protein [Cellulomonas sp.]
MIPRERASSSGRAVRARLAVLAARQITPPVEAAVPAPAGHSSAGDASAGHAPGAAPFGDALAAAAARYADAHGVLPGPEAVRSRVRWHLSPRSALAAGVAVALVAGGVALRAAATRPGDPVELPVPLPAATSPAATNPTATSNAADASATGPGQVVVDVAGAVVHPGVVRLPAGSRVVDALTAAGGADADADLTRLNLARLLVDAEQVLVSRQGDPVAPAAGAGVPAPGAAGDSRVDLNTADAATLETLPGIGPVLAERIAAYRQEHPFSSVDELLDVVGIGPALLDQLRDQVRV